MKYVPFLFGILLILVLLNSCATPGTAVRTASVQGEGTTHSDKVAINTPPVPFAGQTLPVLGNNPVWVNDTTKTITTIGISYLTGNGRDVDLAKAKKVLTLAAMRKSPESMTALGNMYFNGYGVTKNWEAAATLYASAIDGGDAAALCPLAYMYRSGKGLPKDYGLAFQLYQLAADLERPDGIYNTGYMLYKGMGVKQDYSKALKYFTIGANRNDPNCYYMLGQLSLWGYGTTKDATKAKEYLRTAYSLGSAQAFDMIITGEADSMAQCPAKTPSSIPNLKRRKLDTDIMPVFGNSSNVSSLQGRWSGKAYYYDWSRTRVEREEDMELRLHNDDGRLSAKWYINGKLVSAFTADHWSRTWKVTSETEYDSIARNLSLRIMTAEKFGKKDKEWIAGNFMITDKQHFEPEKPMLFVLDKTPAAEPDTAFVLSRTYPNPFDNRLQVDFAVSAKDRIGFRILDAAGICYYTYPDKEYEPGSYTVTLTPSLPAGSYTLVAVGRQVIRNKVIIKNK